MSDFRRMRVEAKDGTALSVVVAGPDAAPPAILLHGFPESHRTWLPVAERLKDRVRLILPDLRGFGESDRPRAVPAYATDTLVEDIFAVADGVGADRFALVGHDWGGAMAWAAALRGDPRITRLGIVNSPHPLIFQRSLIDNLEQRAASQYIRAFRDPAMEAGIAAMGIDAFFYKSFSRHIDIASMTQAEREAYIADWSRPGALTAMFNWYRASQIAVPAMDEAGEMPAWVARGVPKLAVPVRIVWGLKDKALLPVQLENIGEVGADVDVVPLAGVGHFAPWEAPDQVANALRPFLTGE